jgi:hypothetical protein
MIRLLLVLKNEMKSEELQVAGCRLQVAGCSLQRQEDAQRVASKKPDRRRQAGQGYPVCLTYLYGPVPVH